MLIFLPYHRIKLLANITLLTALQRRDENAGGKKRNKQINLILHRHWRVIPGR
jgi:hypothetical protein